MAAPYSLDQRIARSVIRRLANARLRAGSVVFDAVVERRPRISGEYGDRTEVGTRITVLREDIASLPRGTTIIYDGTPEELGELASVTYTIDERDEDDSFVAAYWVNKA
ncbi:hypothetical protein [Cupriavidus necator]|uniref:hypothetical protein n=1 Tax=Cupriavidus necator TaxID=106590 RepID=UPI0005B45EF5|nr:hypothetical protein [Cupriavidus necator]